MLYCNQGVSYERCVDRVVPVWRRREWVDGPGGRRFIVTRVTEVTWPRPPEAPEPWASVVNCAPSTRIGLLADGTIKEAGHGLPYLAMKGTENVSVYTGTE